MRLSAIAASATALALATCGGKPAPSGAEEPATPARRPNLVLILADDLGWKDCSFAGSAYPTPRIDALAASGMVFTRGYASAPSCSPTRASLLTGRYPSRTGVIHAIRNKDYLRARERETAGAERAEEAEESGEGGEAGTFLPEEETTFAELLSAAGYETAFIGKWHLGLAPHLPDRQGFARTSSVGSLSGLPYFGPFALEGVTHGPRFGEYLTDHLTEEAVAFLREPHARPFCLVLAHYAVHGPWQAKPELIEALRAKLDPASEQGSALYGAMIASLDESVGRIVDALDELGLRRDTVVVFTSDNGPTLEKGERLTTTAPLRGGKLALYEGGLRVPWIVSWPGRVAAGARAAQPVVSMDLCPTFLALAGVAPGPAPLDGRDLSPLLFQRGALERSSLFFFAPHKIPSASILRGDEKLVHFFDGRNELYDLARDPGEGHDRSSEDPERTRALYAELARWMAEVGIAEPAGPAPDGAPAPPGG